MKTYKLYTDSFDCDWEAVVQIDETHPYVESKIQEMVDFWSSAEERLDQFDGDYTMAFLQLLGETMMRLSSQQLGLKSIVREIAAMEGWYPMDGEHGITIKSVQGFDFPEIEVEEVAHA